MAHSYTCPFCSHHTPLIDEVYEQKSLNFNFGREKHGGGITADILVARCYNNECYKYSMIMSVYKADGTNRPPMEKDIIYSSRIIPKGSAKAFPDIVPEPIREDYEEACAILDDSPKASATLSRRCMQGVIREYFKVTGKDNLKQEIEAIKGDVSPQLWEALNGLRRLGNFGAHMEQDVNLIIPIAKPVAKKVIKVIEQMIEDTYIARKHREDLFREVVADADQAESEAKSDEES